MMNRILITGGSGFIGTNLVQFYSDLGWKVLNIDQKEPRNSEHAAMFERVDLLDQRGLEYSIRRFDPHYLLHFGARTDLGENRDILGYNANIAGVENLMSACEGCASLRRAVFASSMLVCRYGYVPRGDFDYSPNTLYGESKVLTEKVVRERGLPFEWVLVRPTSIWGPWFGPPYDAFFRFVLSGRFVHPGRAAGTSTYGYIGNTVYQIDRLLLADAGLVHGRVFYLGDFPAINLSEWANEIARLAGRGKIPTVPYVVLRATACLGDLLGRAGMPFPLTSFRLDNMTTSNDCNLEPTLEVSGEPPFTRAEGIAATLRWLGR
jgi:GlcNAc-P-P-Und epimerase